jgi:putative transcriptional regulator
MSRTKIRPKLFDRLSASLREGIEFARGERSLKSTLVTAPPRVGEKEIRALRRRLRLTPNQFAELLRVEPETVRRLESGASRPSGPVLRLIEVFGQAPTVARHMIRPVRTNGRARSSVPAG